MSAPRVIFTEHGTHKTIVSDHRSVSGQLRVSDQELIDALRSAFYTAGWKVIDK